MAGDTEALDTDSSSLAGIEPIENDDDRDDGIDQTPFGDTLPLDSQIGETLALDDPDGDADFDIWGKTQVVDGDDDDDESQRTEVLTDFEDGDQVEVEVVVDSDASTDEEGGRGSARKSFTAVRSASLRSCGLAASRNMASRTPYNIPKSSISGEYSEKQDDVPRAKTSIKVIEAERWPDSTVDPTNLELTVDEVDVDHKFESKAEDDTERADSPPSLATDYAVGGLSYVVSQEPGDLSQANAMGVVDNFLLSNYLGLSQEFKTKKMDVAKSPPTSSTKGAQSLAKKAERRSPFVRLYEWIDNFEDEGGGEFFSKSKEIFFGSTENSRKAHSQPSKKTRRRGTGATRGMDDKSKLDGGGTYLKPGSLPQSDSRLIQHNAARNSKLQTCGTKTKKNPFRNLDEPSNSESREQQLVTTDVGRGEEGTYTIGPDTQMAAEVMEALRHASPLNYEMKEDSHPGAGTVAENLDEGAAKKRNSSKDVSFRKRSFAPHSEGVTTRSKRRKMVTNKSKGSPNLSRKGTRNSRVKISADQNMDAKVKGASQKVEGYLNDRISVNGNESSRSFSIEKAQVSIVGTCSTDLGSRFGSLKSYDQVSVSKGLMLGEHYVGATPVAHRTRHCRAARHTKVSRCRKVEDEPMDVRTQDSIEREDKLVSNTSTLVNAKRIDSGLGSYQTTKAGKTSKCYTEAQEIGGHREEEPRISSFSSLLSHPKRIRTPRTIPEKLNTDSNLDKPSIIIGGMPSTIVQSSTRCGKAKRYVRSVAEISALAKRKKRSVLTKRASKNDDAPLDTRKLPITTGWQRSSIGNPSFKPHQEKHFTECSARPLTEKVRSTDPVNATVVMNHVAYPKEVEVTMEGVDSASCIKNSEDNPKLDGSPCVKDQGRDILCGTPLKKIDAVSPVCMAEGTPRTPSNKKLLRSSLVRELIRLEAFESSSTWMPKDYRKRKDIASIRVLFSHHLDEDTLKQQKKILAKLGVPVASSMSDATHFVGDKFVRTRNMLEAMALGKPVVNNMWLESCGQASCFIDERNYILRDSKKEKEIGFNMPVSLARACQCPLLQGRRVFITPNTKPDSEVISSLVKAAHGQPMERIGRSATKKDKVPDDLLVLSCEEDYTICKPLLEKGMEVFSSELLLNGIVIQKLEYERHRLFLDHVKQTRATLWLRHEDGNRFHPVTKCK